MSRISRNRGQRLPAGSEKTNGVTVSRGTCCMQRLQSSRREDKKSHHMIQCWTFGFWRWTLISKCISIQTRCQLDTPVLRPV